MMDAWLSAPYSGSIKRREPGLDGLRTAAKERLRALRMRDQRQEGGQQQEPHDPFANLMRHEDSSSSSSSSNTAASSEASSRLAQATCASRRRACQRASSRFASR